MVIFTFLCVTVAGIVGFLLSGTAGGIILAIAAAAACIVDVLESMRRELRDKRDHNEKRGGHAADDL